MNKKGISLIVLVITIIVMIIIAGAIILSLSSSNVTTRANQATLASDRGNYQANYATLYAEAVDAEDPTPVIDADFATKLKCKANSYGTWKLSSDGNVYFLVSDEAKFKKAYGNITSTDTNGYTWCVTAAPSGVTLYDTTTN